MSTPKSGWIRQWRNSRDAFGWLAILLHWISALLLIGLLALGIWMVTLTYYDSYYTPAPQLHKSLGMLFAGLLLLRLIWRLSNLSPVIHGKRWEISSAHISHWLVYALLLGIVITGYLMTTAEGSAISVFGWLDIPALPVAFKQQADLMGDWHRWASYALIGLLLVHIAAALKHQWLDNDGTLSRMLGRKTAMNQDNT
jgi:cytochrome b561